MKYAKNISIVFIFLLVFILVGCNNTPQPTPPDDTHECIPSEWEYDTEYICGEDGYQIQYCTICNKELDSRFLEVKHDLEYEEISPTCTDAGKRITTCKRCGYTYEAKIPTTGHTTTKYIVDVAATETTPGIRHRECSVCGEVLVTSQYALNSYSEHGRLRVSGADLLDRNGEKFQLYGLSTHGLQWYGHYVNYDTIESLRNQFGLNVIRLSMYTSEGGYCNGGESKKEELYNLVVEGVEIATKLNLYVVIDWHMVGAEDSNDKNPLYYVNEAKEFFSRISKRFTDYGNVIYEIMNEPCGPTTWADCKNYANQVIPCIRENTNSIILVGNPSWSADLRSVMASPLTGYSNIMYTYHFYAADHKNTSQVKNAYDAGFPVFISEFGFMDSAGHGELDYTSGNNWMEVLDSRNISYIAWNISNGTSPCAIIANGKSTLTDFSDENLKEWGVWLKNKYLTNALIKQD